MAPRSDSHLKRARPPGSPGDAANESYKRVRRSERLSQRNEDSTITAPHQKTPISTKNQLPSPVTHHTEDSTPSFKEPTATPPAGRPSQISSRHPNESQARFSSPPQDTQAFPTQTLDPHAPYSADVQDEIEEGVWGYLIPLDDSLPDTVVLRKRTACPLPNTVAEAAGAPVPGKPRQSGKDALPKEQYSFEKTKTSGHPSGGYLIGRHPECDIIIDDPLISNRHCLIFAENKGNDTVAVLEDVSTNGTYVNEGFVGRNQQRDLKENDEIAVLDKARMVFRYPKTRHTSAFAQQYDCLQKLGKGHFAEVYLCVEKSSGKRFAVKRFTKTPGKEDRSKDEGLRQEIAVLMGVSHPNLLCLKDTFHEPEAVYLVLELAPEGELFNFIIKKQKLSESECRKLFIQLFQGVKYLHDRNVVHRDIKPENILLVDQHLHIKLADFGLAKIIGEESFTTTLCGTPSYVAPEILADGRHRKYTKAVDVWSLGVVLYICLCGFPPFSDELYSHEYPYHLADQIKEARFDYPQPYWDTVGDPALDLIDAMLAKDPAKRYTIDQCLSHPWTTAETPGVNDSTGGLVNAVAGLDFNRRSIVRERTLLSAQNEILVTSRVPMGGDRPDLKIYSKNPKAAKSKAPGPTGKAATGAAVAKEMRPDDARDPQVFAAMGGKGDQELFADDSGSVYDKADIAGPAGGAKPPAAVPDKGKPGKGKPKPKTKAR